MHSPFSPKMALQSALIFIPSFPILFNLVPTKHVAYFHRFLMQLLHENNSWKNSFLSNWPTLFWGFLSRCVFCNATTNITTIRIHRQYIIFHGGAKQKFVGLSPCLIPTFFGKKRSRRRKKFSNFSWMRRERERVAATRALRKFVRRVAAV